MRKYRLILILILGIFGGSFSAYAEPLPVGSAPKPLDFPHFPDRLHTFVWRNWPVIPVEKLAEVVGTTPENIKAVGESMGLPPQIPFSPENKNRIYISLIRRNWHLLPYEQLLTLLDFSAEQLAYILREDDFLYIKLGLLKPKCEPLRYVEPTAATQKRCAEIKKFVQDNFGEELKHPAEARFQFVSELSRPESTQPILEKPKTRFSPCYIYSYFGLYGDPLLNPQLDPYPDGLLERLSNLGVDGVWIHTVLRTLAPSPQFPEFGIDHEIRLENLRNLVQRAKKYHIGIYLYMNEPRAMTEEFFAGRENLKGVKEDNYYTLCTSTPEVRDWLTNSLAYVFEKVPDLKGVFTITASENLTSCASHGGQAQCPRCKTRQPYEIVAEVNSAIEAGVHRSNPNADVIVWDWGWNDSWAGEVIRRLPKSVYLMSVSEWSLPIERGGVKSEVGEYSISAVGPGPRATKHWAIAKQCGLKTLAKMQINNTWELSAVPFLPVMDLIAEHASNMVSTGINGMMLSWSLGGYPSPNLELVRQFNQAEPPSKEAALENLAQTHFGKAGAPHARKAWTAFSTAFREFPYNGSVLYDYPGQYGPSNLLFLHPTGYNATMVGFPYDDLDRWRGPYPPDIFLRQFEKVTTGWNMGIPELEQAVKLATPEKKKDAQTELNFAQAAYWHFASVANQIRFVMNRNALLNKKTSLSEAEVKKYQEEIRITVQYEIKIAEKLFTLSCRDSRIGYEASNHYYYLPVDLMEKALNCRYILDHLDELHP